MRSRDLDDLEDGKGKGKGEGEREGEGEVSSVGPSMARFEVRASEKTTELRASDWSATGQVIQSFSRSVVQSFSHSVIHLQSFTAASFTTPFTRFVSSFVRLLRGQFEYMYLYEWSQAHYQIK